MVLKPYLFSWIFCLVLIGSGSLFGLIAWNSWQTTGRIVQCGVCTFGVVEKLEKRARKIGESGSPHSEAPVVLYYTGNGQRLRYYSTTYSSIHPYAPGDTVALWYLPETPQEATMEGPDSWILPMSFGIFGSVMLLIGLPWLVQLVSRYWLAPSTVD